MSDELDRIMKRRERNMQARPLTLRQKLDELDDLARHSAYLAQEINAAYERHEELLAQRQKNDKQIQSLKNDIRYNELPEPVDDE